MKRSAQFIRLVRIVIPSIVIIVLSAPAYSQQGLRPGVKAPDFALPSVTGEKITLREFQNKKVVIVHFWKSKWKECQAEFPPLQKIYDEFRDVVILSVNVIDKAGRVRSDAEYYELPYCVLIGVDSHIISDYQITKLPRLIVVGKDGKIRLTEPFLSYDDLRKEVERVVKEGP